MTRESQTRAASLIKRFEAEGFTRFDTDGVAILFKMEGSRLTRHVVIVGIAWDAGTATAESFEAQDMAVRRWFAAWTFPGTFPENYFKRRGIDGRLFYILFAEQVSQDAIDAARAPSPKPSAGISTRALVHGPTATVELFEGRRVVGALNIKRLRQQLKGFLDEFTVQ